MSPNDSFPAFGPEPKPKTKRRVLTGIAALGVFSVGIAIGTSAGGSESPEAKPDTVQYLDETERKEAYDEGYVAGLLDGVSESPVEEEAAPAEEPPSGPVDEFSNGTYKVGEDVKPGSYKTSGGSGCYWERAKNDSGDFNSIITNDFFDGPGRVTINEGEFIKASGGCEWTRS